MRLCVGRRDARRQCKRNAAPGRPRRAQAIALVYRTDGKTPKFSRSEAPHFLAVVDPGDFEDPARTPTPPGQHIRLEPYCAFLRHARSPRCAVRSELFPRANVGLLQI